MKKIFLFLIFFLFLWFIWPLRAEINSEYLENIEALSAVALDGLTGQILFAKNPNVKIPPASTVKLLTAMVVLDRLPLTQEVRISKNAEDTPSTPPKLYEGEIYTVEDLLHLMLIKSSNQAAVALAEAVAGSEENFAKLMNMKARTLGLKDSHFVTASGLPAPNQYTTAYELALLLYEALKYPHIKEIISLPVKVITSKKGRTLVVKNTNKLLFEDDLKEEILGGKTGYTRLSKHCLVNVAKVNHRLVITSVLGAPYRDALWEDTKKLIKFSELVLKNQISPVVINTTVNLTVPANLSPKDYYKSKSSSKKRVAKYYAKKPSKNVFAKKSTTKKFYAKKDSKKKIVKKGKKIYTASSSNKAKS
ncbi:MAG: D-alanyl-D-alanine carboxypeptidase family protein [Caldimicrobium sp.]